MPVEITMPQLSDTMTEGTLVKWHKKEGDDVKSGEEIADIETDKATMPMESFEAGTLAVILVAEGEKVNVGQPIGIIAKASENAADIKKKSASRSAAPATAAATPALREQVAASRKPAMATAAVSSFPGSNDDEMRESDATGHGATREPAHPVPPLHSHGNGGRLHVSPLARRIAQSQNIDLTTITGSGPGGRIVKQDLLNAPAGGASKSAVLAASKNGNGHPQIIPLTKMRAAIAKSLVASKQNLPHFYETIDVDVEDLTVIRADERNVGKGKNPSEPWRLYLQGRRERPFETSGSQFNLQRH